VTTGGKCDPFADVASSYLRRDLRSAVGCRRDIFPEGFWAASRGWKRICRVDAQLVCERGVHGDFEASTGQYSGALTFYLVATGWRIARRREGETEIFDWGALLVVLAVGVANVTFGFEAAHSPTGLKYGYPVGPYIFLGSVALIAAAGDVRMLIRGGVSGAQRIARHLWRMCFAWYIASASIFLARPHLFPAFFRTTGLLYFLTLLPLLLMIFWLIRVLFRGRRDLHAVKI
jgi:hypothetical protein